MWGAREGSSDHLADDEDPQLINGTLSFSESRKSPQLKPGTAGAESSEVTDVDVVVQDNHSPENVHFEVDNYRIVGEGRSRHVLYSLLISRTKHSASTSSIIERRYSEFEGLHSALKKKYPKIMREISFPKKLITGNFKPETVAVRSRGFEQFLLHVYSMESIRNCKIFIDFFYGAKLQEAYSEMANNQHENAISAFKECLGLQRTLHSDTSSSVVATLCGLAAASDVLDKTWQAHMYAEAALKSLGTREDSSYLVPLLQFSIRLCWQLGKDKSDLEDRVGVMRSRGFSVDSAATLLEEVLAHRAA